MLLWLAACLVDEGLYREVKADFRDDDGDGYSERGGDCDDADDTRGPGAEEACDGVDNDCNGEVDEDPPGVVWYADEDGDGHGADLDPVHQCSAPDGAWVSVAGDCDDGDADIHPGATEYCDAEDRDEDCDGAADDGDEDAVGRQDWYADDDGDGFGVPNDIATACDQPAGYALTGDDCDDADDGVNPGEDEVCDERDDDCDGEIDELPVDGTAYFADLDTDGYGDPDNYVLSCVPVEGWLERADDCDDLDAAVNPEAQEVCDPDQRDEDCDTLTDDGDDSAIGQSAWFPDGDADGHGAGEEYEIACDPPLGYSAGFDDCDDADAARFPGATESCDAVDTDCDGSTDDADAVDAETWYTDADGDGYGDPGAVYTGCVEPADGVGNALDCDDTAATAWPGAPEGCDAIDNDCDGWVDELVDAVWYDDLDGDGYGAVDGIHGGCPADLDAVMVGGDCDDGDASVSPGAAEVCDAAERDEDCDGAADDGDPSVTGGSTWYTDADGDGQGDPASATVACRGGVTTGGDCDDGDAHVFVGQHEVCNGGDDDCDGTIDVGATGGATWYADADGDGWGAGAGAVRCAGLTGESEQDGDCDDGDAGVSPDATDVVNGIDDDCDGVIDGGGGGDDADGDGVSAAGGDCDDSDAAVHPGAVEICGDGVDADCDGAADGCALVGTLSVADGVAMDGGTSVASLHVRPVADLDADGVEDWLAWGLVGADTQAWLLTDLNGGLGGAVGSIPKGPTLGSLGTYDYGGDLDGDGVIDLRAAGLGAPDPRIVGYSVAPAAFTVSVASAWELYSTESGARLGENGTATGDFDGDGASDVAAAAPGSGGGAGAAYVWVGPLSGAQERADAYVSVLGSTGVGLDRVAACDLDGDGADELVLTEPGYVAKSTTVGAVLVFQSPLAAGETSADATYDGSGTPAALTGASCLADLDGDGLSELSVYSAEGDAGSSGGGQASLLRGVGGGAVQVESSAWATFGGSITGGGLGQAPMAGDLDGDGDADLALAAEDLGGGVPGVALWYAPAGGVHTTGDADLWIEQQSAGQEPAHAWLGAEASAGGRDLLLSDPDALTADGSGTVWSFAAPYW